MHRTVAHGYIVAGMMVLVLLIPVMLVLHLGRRCGNLLLLLVGQLTYKRWTLDLLRVLMDLLWRGRAILHRWGHMGMDILVLLRCGSMKPPGMVRGQAHLQHLIVMMLGIAVHHVLVLRRLLLLGRVLLLLLVVVVGMDVSSRVDLLGSRLLLADVIQESRLRRRIVVGRV